MRIKRIISVFLCVMSCAALFAQSRSQETVERFYSLYDDFVRLCESKDLLKAEEVSSSIRNQFDELRGAERMDVVNILNEDYMDVLSDTTKKTSVALKAAERALFILPQDEPSCFDILCSIADVYVDQNNHEMLQATILRMLETPYSKGDNGMELINDYQEKVDKITPFPKVINGHWIADRIMTDGENKGRPFLIVDIYSDNKGKWAAISELSGISSTAFQQKYSPLRKSREFDFDVREGTFVFSFYTNNVQQGNAAAANGFLSNAQESRATFHALAQDSRATIGQSATAELMGGLFSMANEYLARRAATSRASEDIVYISGSKVDDNTLACNIKYQFQRSDSYTMQTDSQPLLNQDFTFYRWDKEDGLVFGLPNCQPISPYVDVLSPGMKLYDIKKKTSFWQLKYGGVALLGIAAGAAGVYYGVTKLKSGVDNKIEQDRKTGRIALICGSAFTLTVPLVEHSIRKKNRAKAVSDYNMEEFLRMYQMHEVRE